MVKYGRGMKQPSKKSKEAMNQFLTLTFNKEKKQHDKENQTYVKDERRWLSAY